MISSNILIVLAIIVTVSLVFGLGFLVGATLRVLGGISLSRPPKTAKPEPGEEEVDEPGGAVADSSPQHLRAKREARVRKGQDPIDEAASQIITQKTPDQLREEADAAKEAKLDKWMPGVKRGKG